MRRMNSALSRFSFVLAPLCAVLTVAPTVQAEEIDDTQDTYEVALRADDPEVEISSPKNKAKFDEGKSVKVKVDVESDADIEKVVLEVDGDEEKADKKKPYEWTLKKLKPGTHTLQAIAFDEDDNEGKSKKIKITIEGEESGEGEDTETDEDTDGSGGGKADKKEGVPMPDGRGCGSTIGEQPRGLVGGLMVLGLVAWSRRRKQ